MAIVTLLKQFAIAPTARGFPVAGLVIAPLLAFPAVVPAQQHTGPQGPEQGALRQQLWLVPSQDPATPMRTAVFRPPGPGPFPLVIINHGSIGNAETRANLTQPVFLAASEFFVQRGYAVAVPQRPGHGATGGPYLEGNTPSGCASADYRRSGLATADSIAAAIAYFTAQPFVKRVPVLVVGQSAGGWGALALASRNPKDVRAIVNFAGGRGGRVNDRPNNNCAPEKLIDAAAHFGTTARIPVLSIYTQNDSYFSPSLSKDVNDAFAKAGGRVEFHILPAFGRDGHSLFGSRDGVVMWAPIIDGFLKRH